MFLRLDHIGIIVHDIEEAARQFSERLGVVFDEQSHIDRAGMKVALFNIGDTQIELIQFGEPIPGVDPLVLGRGRGLQHIAFQVEDLDEALSLLTQRGVRVLKGFPRQGVHGMIAFLNPDDMAGALVEICELKKDAP